MDERYLVSVEPAVGEQFEIEILASSVWNAVAQLQQKYAGLATSLPEKLTVELIKE